MILLAHLEVTAGLLTGHVAKERARGGGGHGHPSMVRLTHSLNINFDLFGLYIPGL